MPLLSWQLWLAREIVKDNPLLAKQQTDLTPGRVAQGFQLLAAIGTPAVDLRKVSGWPQVSRARRELATQWSKDYAKTENSVKQQSQKSA